MSGSGGGNAASTSTSTACTSLSGEVRKEIEALFNWNPRRLRTPDDPTSTTTMKNAKSTQLPAYYDKHFSKNMVLLHVKHLPSLVQQLQKNVDEKLLAASATLPRGWYPENSALRDSTRRRVPTVAQNEAAVSYSYQQFVPPFCLPLVSTLTLHPKASKDGWKNLLTWTPSSSSSGYAIMDGELQIMQPEEPPDDDFDKVVATMDPEIRGIVEEMRIPPLTSLATWEFKSLATGNANVMKGVYRFKNFLWTFCSDKECEQLKEHKSKANKAIKTTIGPDAQKPPWTLNCDSLDPPTDPDKITTTLPPDEVSRPHSPSTSMPPPPPPPQEISAYKSSADMKGKRKASPAQPQAESSENPKAGKHKRGDGPILSAQHILQQAWAQAVNVDGTIVVIHSGNHELICLRHRASQTLYVSDLIEPSTCANPGYGKLQVGVYIAGVQDAIDRKKQRPNQPTSESPNNRNDDSPDDDSPDDYTLRDRDLGGPSKRNSRKGSQGGQRKSRRIAEKRSQGGGGGRGKSTAFQSMIVKKSAGVDESVAVKIAENRDVLFLSLCYDIYNSPTPATFLRSAPPITEGKRNSTLLYPRDIGAYRPRDCHSVTLTSEIGQGATGVVHRGVLDVNNGSTMLDVVVKLAFDEEQKAALKDEYEMYRLLRLKGVVDGIATVLGLFNDFEGGPSALVMLYAGEPLQTEQERTLSPAECQAALATLKSIHQIDVLHGDIRPRNILVGASGIMIIDFAYSHQCKNQLDKEDEYQQLHSLLNNFRDTCNVKTRIMMHTVAENTSTT